MGLGVFLAWGVISVQLAEYEFGNSPRPELNDWMILAACCFGLSAGTELMLAKRWAP